MTADGERDAVTADAVEAEFRHRFTGLDPVLLRTAAEASAQRARRDLAEVETSGRAYREAADA